MIALLAVMSLLGAVPEGQIDADQFARLIQGLHSEIRDVSLVYEGRIEYPMARTKNQGPQYQAVYALRSDGAILYDVYLRSNDPNQPFTHDTHALLGNKMTSLGRVPDLPSGDPVEKRASPGRLDKPGSIQRILFLGYFGNPYFRTNGYEFEGWETVDNHRCLRVRFGAGTETMDETGTRFWIDMERGGHPLKAEWHDRGHLTMRTDGIRLKSYPAPGGETLWLPVVGLTSTFATTDGYSNSPNCKETYEVVEGSVRLNADLPDKQFAVDWNGGMPDSDALKRIRHEYESIPPFRTDPAGVKANLNRRLALADSQAQQLEASSTAREPWDWSPAIRIMLAVLGVALVIVVGVYKWRSR